MHRLLKLTHLIGFVMALGSIATFIVISSHIEGASLENIAFGRIIISNGSKILTLPGMCLLAITGVWMGLRVYDLKQRFFQLKLLLITLIIINGYFFVMPFVTQTTEIAIQSIAQGQLIPRYRTAYIQESVCGAANVLFILAAAIIGVWNIGNKSTKSGKIET